MSGLKAAGFKIGKPDQADLLLVWNRYGAFDDCARRCEQRGGAVLVAENGYLGNDFAGSRWFALANGHHNGAGWWAVGGNDRWDSLGVKLEPWRDGREIVVLPQRGIGPVGVAMPRGWGEATADRLRKLTKRPVRIRKHPGKSEAIPLADDLRDAHAVVTWGSGAALKAIVMGVPVFHDFPKWIGASASRPMSEFGKGPMADDAARLSMFRRLAWAMWRVEEIASGEAIRAVL